MNEKEELINNGERSFIFSSFYKLFIVLVVIFSAIFIGKILFGVRSLEVLFKLQDQEELLKNKIKIEKQENEKLQKKLFEYQLSVPDAE
jgi:hypothetical protein